jgi:hypothetical protein
MTEFPPNTTTKARVKNLRNQQLIGLLKVEKSHRTGGEELLGRKLPNGNGNRKEQSDKQT